MAIRIDGLPGGPVYVENAAEESTLQELLRVMGSQTTRQRRSDADQAAAQKRIASAADDAAASMTGVAGAARSAASSTSSGWNKLESGLNAATMAAEDFKNSRLGFEMQRLATTVTDASITWTKSIKAINADNIGAAGSLFATSADLAAAGLKGLSAAGTGVLDLLGPFGQALQKAGYAAAAAIIDFSVGGLKLVNSILNKELAETIKNMATFNKMGASFSGSFMELREIANQSGLTIEQFTAAVAASEQSVRQFGLPFAEGARKVSEVSAALGATVNSAGRSLRDDLRALGYNTEEQIELASEYMAMQRTTMTAEQFKNLQAADVARATKAYAIDLKVLQDITGKNAKAAMEEARTRSLQADIMAQFTDPEQAKKFQKYFATLPESAKKGFLQYIASGGQVITDGATNIVATENKEFARIFSRGREIIFDSSKSVADAQRAGLEQTIRAKNSMRDFVRVNGAVIPTVTTLTGSLSDVTGIYNDLVGGLFQNEKAIGESRTAAENQAAANDKLTTGIINAQTATQNFANQVEKIALEALPDYAKGIGNATGAFVGVLDTSLKFLLNKPLEGQDRPQTYEQYKANIEEILKTFIRKTIPGIATQPGVQPRANGGPIVAGMPYIVGERGPELRIFDQSGFIQPLDKFANNFNQPRLTDQTRSMQEVFANNFRELEKALAQQQNIKSTDLEPIRELPIAVGQVIEDVFSGPRGFYSALNELKNQLAEDNQNNKQILEQQIEELRNLVTAMRDNVTYSERIANELA